MSLMMKVLRSWLDHESLFNRFKAIVRYSYWMFERCTKTEVNDSKKILELLRLTNELSEEEKTILSLDWYTQYSYSPEMHNGRW